MVGYQDLNGNVYFTMFDGLLIKVAKYALYIDALRMDEQRLPDGTFGIACTMGSKNQYFEFCEKEATSWQITEPMLEGKILLPTMTQTFPINKKYVPAICETLKLKGIYGS